MSGDIKQRIAKSLFWVAWSRVGVQTLSFCSTLVVARLLHPNDYGLMAMATVWTSAMSLLAEMGLGAAIIQFRDLEESELNACFWLTMGVASAGYFILYAAAPALATWFASPRLATVLRVLGLILPLLAVQIVPDSLLRKRLALDKVSKAEIVASLSAIPVVLGMAWAGAGVWALVAGALLQSLVRDMVTFWFVRWWPQWRLGSGHLREVFNFSLATLGTRLCWVSYQEADAIVLGKVSGAMALGFYSMAKELTLLPVTKIAAVVNQIASPMMAELQDDRGAMRTSLLRTLGLVACVTLPLCVGLAMVSEDLVRVILTDKWISIVPLMRVLAGYSVMRSLSVLLPPVLLARYRARFLFSYTLTLLLCMPLAFWVGAAWLGSIGVAAAWVLVYPIIMARMVHEALREIEGSWTMLWEQVRASAGATLLMAIVVLAVQWLFPQAEVVGSFVRLVGTTGVGAVTYGLVMFLFGGQVVQDMWETVRLILWPQKTKTAGN
ncbi:MAG TPA: lipopolysaccharide biosynthesis protein [Candidatus Saccharimonadia bacterium]|nr:lipopolysaccharide biosynthesis protein [Candidatus Saccharimonadia bacterium]